MKKRIIVALAASLLVTACGGDKVVSIPKPPKNLEVIEKLVPVPVLCTVEIEKAKTAIDEAERGLKLEAQNAMLRATVAQQRAYIKALEAGIVGCGGKIKD